MEWKQHASVIFAGTVIANFWLSSLLEDVSAMPVVAALHYLVVIVCGALLYLVIKDIRRTFYAVCATSLLVSLLITLVLYIPASLNIVAEKESMFYVALRQGLFMILINFPLCFGGAMGASVVAPD